MEVLAGIVVIRVAIPSAFPRVSGLILFSVMDAEVVGLEPTDPKRRTRNPAWEVSEIVVSNDRTRRIRGACLDVVETIASGEASGDAVEDLRIDGAPPG